MKVEIEDKNLKVLIVDDRIENIIALERVLEHLEVEIVRAQSGNEAVILSLEEEFSLILLDVQMPEMDGFETASFIRKDGVNKFTPIIFISAIYKDDYYKIKGVQSGAVDFITKPFVEELVVGKVEVFLEMFSQKQQIIKHMFDADQIKNYLKNLIDTFPSFIIGIDDQGLVQFWNEDAEKISGRSSVDVEGVAISEILKDFPVETDEIVNAMRLKHSYERNSVLCELNEKQYHFDIHAYPIYSSDNSGVIRIDNVTDKIRIEKELAQAQRLDAVGQLAGGIAHDFNNMLSGVIGGVELIRGAIPQTEKTQKYIEMIMNSAERATDLASKLLVFGCKQHKDSTIIDVHKSITDTGVILENTIDKRITIEYGLEAKEFVIAGDISQLQNVFLNLGINASHAMPEGGVLSFKSCVTELDESDCSQSSFNVQPGKYIDIEVSDTGVGISLENQAKIFDPFFTTKEVGKGTGLGLAASYGTVVQHDGIIRLDSELGKGACFRILLPLSESNVTDEIHQETLKTGTGCVLVVEDEAILRATAEAFLEEYGYSVLLAENGQEAVTIYQEKGDAIDIVLCDMNMPIMNGLDCFEELKNINPDVKFILSSGYTRSDDIYEMKKNGIIGVLPKPYRNAELNQIITAGLQGKGV
jgi:PAS domain S-box-containing protein